MVEIAVLSLVYSPLQSMRVLASYLPGLTEPLVDLPFPTGAPLGDWPCMIVLYQVQRKTTRKMWNIAFHYVQYAGQQVRTTTIGQHLKRS